MINKLYIKKKNYEKAVLIAQKLNIEAPSLNNNSTELNLYSNGTLVLKSEIKNIVNQIENIKNSNYDFNPSLDQASKIKMISSSPAKYGILVFMTTLFFSIIFVLTTKFSKNN